MQSKNTKTVLIIVAGAILVGVGYLLFGKNADTDDGVKVVNEKFGTVVEKEATDVQADADNYVDFTSNAYEKARSEGKVVMLYFTANWCPTCRAQEPINIEAFSGLKDDDEIVIFRAHILDSETTDVTEKLADELGVRLQHTFVIISPAGEVVFTHTGPLVEKDLVDNLLSAKD